MIVKDVIHPAFYRYLSEELLTSNAEKYSMIHHDVLAMYEICCSKYAKQIVSNVLKQKGKYLYVSSKDETYTWCSHYKNKTTVSNRVGKYNNLRTIITSALFEYTIYSNNHYQFHLLSFQRKTFEEMKIIYPSFEKETVAINVNTLFWKK